MEPLTIAAAIQAASQLFAMIKEQGAPAVKAALKFVQKPNPSEADVNALFADIEALDLAKAKAEARDRADKLAGTGIYAPDPSKKQP